MTTDAAPGITSAAPTAPRRFDGFVLDPADRRLSRDGATIDISGRYLDALILLTGEAGRLVSKDRFMAEVWKGVPVTDEALTQCIRALRKALGDDATRPRFIETAPRHGYRFVARVEPVGAGPVPTAPQPPVVEPGSPPPEARAAPLVEPLADWRRFRVRSAAAMIGGGGAGLVGGLIYGLVAASGLQGSGMGASSVLVMTGLTLWVGLVGGAGVGAGIAAASLKSPMPGPGSIAGGALGGLLVGGLVKLIGVDAFALLLGQSPGAITGAGEGAAL
ncbi:winged helix-turn-helix domain-containing protein, partial [Brevundimonas sp.]